MLNPWYCWFRIRQHLAVHLAFIQLLFVGSVACVIAVFNQHHAISFAAGGLVELVPHFFFGLRVLRLEVATKNAMQQTASIMFAMLIKLAFTAVLFVMVWRLPWKVEPLCVFAGFIVALIPQLIYPVFVNKK